MDGQVEDLEERPRRRARPRSRLRSREPAATPAASSASAVASVPRKTSRTAGLASTSPGRPSPTIRPPARQRSRSTPSRRARTTCSIQMTAMPVAGRADDRDELGDLRVGEPAGDLVEKQEAGPVASARASSRRLRASRPSCPPDGSPCPRGRSPAGVGGQLVAGSAVRPAALLSGDEDVLEHGHVGEGPRHLVRPPDAQAAATGGIGAQDRPPIEPYLTRVRGQVPRDQPEHARLAGAVRADDAEGIGGPDGKRKLVGDEIRPNRFETSSSSRSGAQAQPLVGWRSPPTGTSLLRLLSTTTISQGIVGALAPLDADGPDDPDAREGALGEIERPADARSS